MPFEEIRKKLAKFRKVKYIHKFVLKNDVMLFTRKPDKEFKKTVKYMQSLTFDYICKNIIKNNRPV